MGGVEEVDEGGVLVDNCGEVGCVFAGEDELVDGLVGGLGVVIVGEREGKMGTSISHFIFVVVLFSILYIVQGSILDTVNPRLDIKARRRIRVEDTQWRRVENVVQRMLNLYRLILFFLDIVFIVQISQNFFGGNDIGRAKGEQR